ncbi:ankyrin repeat protein, putative [Trichomonas vaginalis G3]|uniref:Ankyrin repeat protein, putative n=1 Tax=Trichomonas vaginalis (strain ATCC PRA-98 / G3) TaxID=412133 RepID=A2E1J1_TRIV3|nr:ankyrin repeat protein family [Trichomonas vaginalis G3]EAY13438.1 ankyrin repeat protein, putative [Trichomonas vaginalis G3]KAI5518378.1 ankyrin repeat protein family [Trichomonas vaginalis G3]|eukprot:XP_001325661.1 ankyrin repeat protein [Trichomonas vaginalis G3]
MDSDLILNYEYIAANIQEFIDEGNLYDIFEEEDLKIISSYLNMTADEYDMFIERSSSTMTPKQLYKRSKYINVSINNNKDLITILQSVQKYMRLELFNNAIKYLSSIQEQTNQEFLSPKSQLNEKELKIAQLNEEVLSKEFQLRFIDYKNSTDFQSIYDFFCEMAEKGYSKFIAKACEEGLSDKKNANNNNILIEASIRGNLKLVKYLIESGCDKESRDNKGCTPLIHASIENNIEVINYLISVGANIEGKDNSEATALHIATHYNNIDIVKYLISVGANIEVKDKNGWTSLHYASVCNHIELVKYLIHSGADKEVKDKIGLTPFIYASINGNLELVKFLISIGCDKEAKAVNGKTPLHEASFRGHLEVAKYLVSSGANIEARDNDNRTPLLLSLLNDKPELAKYFFSIGANKEARDNYGETPLHIASFLGNIEIVKYLISAGVNKEAKTRNGNTLLNLASHNGKLEVVKYLISIGANKEAKDKNGRTPLLNALYYKHFEIAKYLISIGADIEAKDIDGRTPLMWAADRGNFDVVNVLDQLAPIKKQQIILGFIHLFFLLHIKVKNIIKYIIIYTLDINLSQIEQYIFNPMPMLLWLAEPSSHKKVDTFGVSPILLLQKSSHHGDILKMNL